MLKLWMRSAEPAEQALLAERTGTTRGYLYHLAADEDTAYHREPRPELAAAIETECAAMHKESRGRLPLVYRTDLVAACRRCAFAQKCLGPAAVRADFPLVIDGADSEGGYAG